MKKNSTCFQKRVLILVMIICSSVYCIAQPNAINISITGIEYDDPGFSLLKESLQKNKNVTAVKPGYEQGTAKLNFNYSRSAQNLWNNLYNLPRLHFDKFSHSLQYLCFSQSKYIPPYFS